MNLNRGERVPTHDIPSLLLYKGHRETAGRRRQSQRFIIITECYIGTSLRRI